MKNSPYYFYGRQQTWNIVILVLLAILYFDSTAQDTVRCVDVRVVVEGIEDKVTSRRLQFIDLILYSLPDTVKVGYLQKNHIDEHEIFLKDTHIGAKFVVYAERKNSRNLRAPEEVFQMMEKEGEYASEWTNEFTVTDSIKDGVIRLPVVRLKRPWHKLKTTTLQEVTVTASKVKFYHKGDTLIYNADAFLLPEGSMLDALVSQLPGVVLKEDGRIFCNGRFVEELLLNGRDLFNGDRMLMLENLAAYTVKDIAVYDKRGPKSELAGFNVGDTRHVMDVRLKREYSNGWIVNAEAGGGTRKRYLGRLFALWYSDNASISAYAGANNLNDVSVPGREESSWTPEMMRTGVSQHQNGGIVYTVKGPSDKWNLKGDMKFKRSVESVSNRSRSVNFLEGGDSYSYGWLGRRDRDWSLTSSHSLWLKTSAKNGIGLSANVDVRDAKNTMDISEGTFSREIGELTKAALEDIYSSGDSALRAMVNRNRRETLSTGRSASGYFAANMFMPLFYRDELHRSTLDMRATFSAGTRHARSFDRYAVNFGQNPVPADAATQFVNGSPQVDNRASLYVKYWMAARAFNIGVSYDYYYSFKRTTSLRYQLDSADGFDDKGSGLGTLPSMRELDSCIDPDLSHLTRLRTHSNKITPSLDYTLYPDSDMFLHTQLELPLEILSRRYTYSRPELDERIAISPSGFLPGLNWFMFFRHNPKGGWESRVNASLTVNSFAADPYNMIDVRNDADPLNVYTGNPDLKNALQIFCSANWNLLKSSSPFRHSFRISFSTILDQFARGFLYDRTTGVRTFRTYNVDGNRNISAGYDLSCGFGRNRCLDLSSNSSGRFRNSVDLVGTELTESGIPPKQTVRTFELHEKLSLSWTKGRTRVTGFGWINWSRYTSPDASIANSHSLTFGYGVSAFANLPKGWGISSDISLYARRGFDDQRLNSSDLIWNARITKSLLKGQLLLVLDGYDILHQLSSISYSVNAQAKTETVSNVIPNYFLLHIQWRFNKKPKKRY